MAYIVTADLAQLGYDLSDITDAANFLSICESASKAVDAYCHQTFAAATAVTEDHDVRVINGIAKIFPYNLTISSVTSVTVTDGDASIVCTGLFYWPQYAYIRAKANACDGRYQCALVYSYGYSPIPADLVKATVFAAAPLLDDYFLSKDANVSMVKTIRQGSLTIERADTDDIPKQAKSILDNGYRRVRSG